MTDEAQSLDSPPPVDPYGDVALGVECAWPAVIPVAESLEDLAS
jgi:hypothetical protein